MQGANENFNTMQNLFQTSANLQLQQQAVSAQSTKLDPNSSDDIFKSMGLNL